MPRPQFLMHQGDCLSVLLNHVALNQVDVAVTSPPYNIEKTDAGEFEVKMSDGEYLNWLMCRLGAVHDCLKPDGSLFLNIAGKPSKPQLPYMLVGEMLNCGWHLQNTIQWVKSISIETGGEFLSQGHFKPINSKRFLNDLVEPIFHFTKTGRVELDRLAVGVPYQDKSNISRWESANQNDKRCRGNVWFIPHKTRTSKAEHPTAFPIELPRMCIRLHGRPNPVVMDPFMGSGTTALAAVVEGASTFIGVDQSAKAVDMSITRLIHHDAPVDLHRA